MPLSDATSFSVVSVSRHVVGWAMADHLQASLAVAALGMALEERRPIWGSLIHHSDRWVQCGAAYTGMLIGYGIAATCRVGNPYDNAKAESFMTPPARSSVRGKSRASPS
ncbi:DDE-type integrase/transposase/recombinase [Reyranella soli]|uniref:Integrase catalytic domain-containing protein n=1 Tax=Reyranella soli TaxID=1230389 RepID=A0A512N8P5_9HYPH|nr:DDE-type integrase/transposase/recombinase [Reyranella soli]GEP55352.1 hypothetical protein RSO01_25180 [Reyranella soli]